jgi:cytochrome b pre-mRNA-processing protein 3
MKQFFQSFFKKAPDINTIGMLYGAIMAQARGRVFFERYGLSDDFETRFESLTLHMFLVLRCLSKDGQGIKQGLVDYMVSDLDRTLREMGVGDVGVVKRMKHFMEGFYGRVQIYEKAMGADDKKEILRVLDRNLYGASDTNLAKLELMRDYIVLQCDALAKQPLASFADGHVFFVKG